jgi:hypothetical protein
MMNEHDEIFRQIVNESKITISNMDSLNSKIHNLAHRYFEASENAEKFIYNYQELKLNIDVPFLKRKSLHESVLNTISIAKDKEKQYREYL